MWARLPASGLGTIFGVPGSMVLLFYNYLTYCTLYFVNVVVNRGYERTFDARPPINL
jgi:hypothetical protein